MEWISEIQVMATCTFDNGRKLTARFNVRTFNKGLWKEEMALQIKNNLNSSGVNRKCVKVRVH